MKRLLTLPLLAALVSPALGQGVGYTNTPQIRGQKWKVHDKDRPNPATVTPGATFSNGAPAPSDAIVLFNGKDLSRWKSGNGDAKWKVENGYFEVAPGKGDLRTRDEFGDVQLHLEFATPSKVEGESQGRGNSGVFFHEQFEIQVLDSHKNKTYADGQAGGLYGQWPPLVNAIRPPGEWNTYDIVFEAPQFDGDGKLVKPAYVTAFLNGVCVHNRKELNGPTNHQATDPYKAYSGKGGIRLQDHGNPTRFRNIWARAIGSYN